MPNSEISDQTLRQLRKPIVGQVRFSDVYAETTSLAEEAWWRKTDFDAELTDEVESSGFPKAKQIPVGLRPWLTNYGLILADDLLRSRNQRAAKLDNDHPDALKEQEESAGAIVALANYAPRDNDNVAHDSNGSDFYLAITDAGLEIYATPLSFLRELEARNRIIALYRIPTKGHPQFNGEHEQFRSARVIRSRRHPEHLVPVFEYNSHDDLLRAKEQGTHPQVIPREDRPGHLAFVDKFGNIKLELQDTQAITNRKVGETMTLHITNKGKTYEFEVHIAENLRSAPLGKLAMYANCSDHDDSSSNVGLVELITRVNGNPSTATDTAIFQLLEQIPDLDIATAEVALG